MPCKLCLENKPLRHSHIIPEFLYKNENLYDEKRRFLRLSFDPAQPHTLEQKGRREYLLCGDCEQLLNKQYEQYAKRILYDKRHLTSTQLSYAEILHNVDYTRFKLFELSILWRASISTLPEFSDVDLGSHEERIRQMLLNCDPGGPYEYGCLLLDPDTEIDPRTQLQIEHSGVLKPETIEVYGYTGVLFMFGGLLWTFIVSDLLDEFPDKDRLLSQEGKLFIAKDVNNAAKELLQRIILEIQMIEEQRRKP